MSAVAAPRPKRAKPGLRLALAGVVAVILIAAMALDTKVVRIGSSEDVHTEVFSPEAFGAAQFPRVQAEIEKRAVDAKTLAEAIAKDKAAASKQYGVDVNGFPDISVKFTGVVGEGKSGIYFVTADGVPDTLRIRVQTGPAINGTELRDATGTISFDQFTNQIEYQNAGSALNNAMKKQVLSKIDTTTLTGKTISVVGAFKLVNPNAWLVTPVRLDLK